VRPLGIVVCVATLVLVATVPAAGRSLDLRYGQGFRVAGTRAACSYGGSAESPLLQCGLRGRTTRVLPGTIAVLYEEGVVDLLQRTLSGSSSVVAEFLQPAASQPGRPRPAPARTFSLSVGDVVAVAGTDVSCSVVRRDAVGIRCARVEPRTWRLVPLSLVVTVSEADVRVARVDPAGQPHTVFSLREPPLPAPATVVRAERSLRLALRDLRRLRSVYRGYSRRRYLRARSSLAAIAADLAGDRYVSACRRFTPLLLRGFYLPRGAVLHDPGRSYVVFVERIERAVCG
jgi:hypothetical protein